MSCVPYPRHSANVLKTEPRLSPTSLPSSSPQPKEMDRVPQVAMAEHGLDAQAALYGLCHLDLGLQRECLSGSVSVYVGLAKEQWSNREAHM